MSETGNSTPDRRSRNRQSTNLNNESNNPCLKEYKMANKCSLDNIDDKDKCKPYFGNYRTCMDFWLKVKADRRNSHITPVLPPPEEREAIKAEYLARSRR